MARLSRRSRRPPYLLRRLASWLLSGALVFVLLTYVALPIAARHALEIAFERHDIPASVDAVRISLLESQVRLVGLRLGSHDPPSVSWGEVRVDVSLKALFQGRIRIHALQARDASFDLAVLSDPSWARGLDDSGAIAREWQVRVDDIEIRELRLRGISERLRRDVVVERAWLSDLQGPRRGEPVDFELRLRVAEAPLDLVGRAVLTDTGPRLSGRYRVGGIDLSGMERVVSGAPPMQLAGVVRGAGRLEAVYRARAGIFELDADGRLALDGMGATVAATRFSNSDFDWNGELRIVWPALAVPDLIRIRGAVDARHVEWSHVDERGARQHQLVADGVEWQGELQWTGDLRANGTVVADTATLTGPPGTDDRQSWRLTVQDVGWRARAESVAGAGPEGQWHEHLRARRGRMEWRAAGTDGFELEDLAVARFVRAGTGEYRVPALTIARAAALRGGPGSGDDESARPRWEALGIRLEGLRATPQGRFGAQWMGVTTLRHDHRGQVMRVVDLEIDHPRHGPDGRLRAVGATSSALQWTAREGELWVFSPVVAGIQVDSDGRYALRRLSIASATKAEDGDIRWTGSGLNVSDLRAESAGAIDASRVAARTFQYQPSDGVNVRSRDTALAQVSAATSGTRVTARSGQAAQTSFTAPDEGNWGALSWSGRDLAWDAQAGITARDLAAGSVTHDDLNGARWALGQVSLARFAALLSGFFRADSMGVASGSVRRADGVEWRARGLETAGVERPRAGEWSAATVALEDLSGSDGAGLTWRLGAAAAQALRRRARDELDVDGLHAGRLEVHTAGAGTWAAVELETARVEWRAPELYSAGPVTARRLIHGVADGVDWQLEHPTAVAVRWRPGRLPGAESLVAERAAGRSTRTRHWSTEALRMHDLQPTAQDELRVRHTRARGWVLEDSSRNHRWQYEHASASNLGWSAQRGFETDALTIEALRMAPIDAGDAPRVVVDQVRLERPRIVPGRVIDLGNVALTGLAMDVGVTETRQWLVPEWPFAESLAGRATLKFQSLEAVSAARLAFHDHSVFPPVVSEFSPLELSLGDFDGADYTSRTSFELRTRAGRGERARMTGHLRPTPDGVDFEVRGRLDDADLTRVARLGGTQLRGALTGGRADIEFDAVMRDGHVEGSADVVMREPQFAPAPAVDGSVASGTAGSGEPLATILALLEDEERQIRLTVPFSGAHGEARLGFHDAVDKSVSRTAQARLSMLLAPVGMLVGASDAVVSPRLVRAGGVEFEPGQARVRTRDLTRAQALAEYLRRHPKPRVRMCGRAVPMDVEHLARASRDSTGQTPGAGARVPVPGEAPNPRRAALSLARLRADVVRDHLVDDLGVAPDRLLHCDPLLDMDDAEPPRVEFHVEPWSSDPPRRPTRRGTNSAPDED